MALDVEPADIKNNEKVAAEMEQSLAKALKLKDQVLAEFTKKLKRVEKDAKEMQGIVDIAKERCEYQKELQKQIAARLNGKRKASLEKEDDRRVTEFIDAVKKEDLPKFEELLKELENDLNEIKDALK